MKSFILLFLITFSVLAEDEGSAGNAIRITADTPWIVAADEPEAMQRALADVERDWIKVFGHRPVVLTRLPERWSGPVVYFGTKQPRMAGMPEGAESFVLRVRKDEGGRQVLAAGGPMPLLSSLQRLTGRISPSSRQTRRCSLRGCRKIAVISIRPMC